MLNTLYRRLIAALLVSAVVATTSQAEAIAQNDAQRLAEEITASAEARSFAVSMLNSPFQASWQAAIDALGGSDQQWSDYVNETREAAQRQDLRQILTTLATIGGPNVQQRANELLNSGTTEQMGEFIDSGWEDKQLQDDLETAWQATAEADEGSTLKRAADEALRDRSPDALAEFAATGADIARSHDRKRQVYELTNSPLPSVAAGASEAVKVGTDTAIEGFLRYGQFVAAAQDAERMDIAQLVDLSLKEAKTAANENTKAWMQADRAARAAEAARVATEKSRDEAMAAHTAQTRAGNAAVAAGNLASQAAQVADQAVAASQEARRALRQTADALSRAASAAARAQAAASAASAAASAAAYDRNQAAAARKAAEQARNAAQAAQRSVEAYNYAAEAAGHAQAAGRAAGSAAANADAAAAAATNAANAAGVSEHAAAEAHAGAARARAAAARARNAADQVDGLVGQIQRLVDDVQQAAENAAAHANNAATAADDAAREAGNARYAAEFAGKHADTAAAAAERSRQNVELAVKTHEVSTISADQRFEDERAFLKEQAITAREVQDAQDHAAAEENRRREDLTTQMEELVRALPEDEAAFTADEEAISSVRQLALAAAQVGTPAVAGAAKVALEGNTAEDLRDFAFRGYPDAIANDDLNTVSYLALYDPNENIRTEADLVGYEDPAAIAEFLHVTLPAMRAPELLAKAWELRDTAGLNTQEAADDAIRDNTFDKLDVFVNGGGFERARLADQLEEAYALVESGSPEVKMAADIAVTGDRAGLNEFITVEQYRRAMLDHQRDAHNANVVALLDMGAQAADSASEQAANARAAHQRAIGSAQRAEEYAKEARGWAGRAADSAKRAQEHVASAKQALQFAEQQRQRAHDAATAAEADAVRASSNADRASTYAATARASANHAAAEASSARESANAANQDAAAASQAANDAYLAAWQLELSELEQARSAAAEGLLTVEPQSAVETIRAAIGKESLDVILDFIGIGDILKCFKGQFNGCIWAGLGLLPLGKATKAIKAMPAIRRLIAKSNDIKYAFQYSRLKTALDDALVPVACRILPSGAGGDVGAAARRCPIPDTVVKVNNRYPINARFAGGFWRNGNNPPGWPYGNIPFNKKGFPVFDEWVDDRGKPDGKPYVEITPTGSRARDSDQADKLAGITREEREDLGLVWHHHEEYGRMQLVPLDLHKEVRHTGGFAIWGRI